VSSHPLCAPSARRQGRRFRWRIGVPICRALSLESFPLAPTRLNRKQIAASPNWSSSPRRKTSSFGKPKRQTAWLRAADEGLETAIAASLSRHRTYSMRMYASLADRSSRQLLKRLRADVLLIDEFGYLNLKPEQSKHLLQADGGTLSSALDHHYNKLGI